MTFKMIRKPVNPKQMINIDQISDISDFSDISEILALAASYGVRNPSDIKIVDLGWSEYSNSQAKFCWSETDKDYKKRVRAYEKKLAHYEIWRTDNADEIEKIEIAREGVAKQKKLDAISKEKIVLRKRLSQIKKQEKEIA